jgi:hypothetical protein
MVLTLESQKGQILIESGNQRDLCPRDSLNNYI